jgi:hypothetical protein
MDSSTIQRWQAEKLRRTLQPTVGFLHRLRQRMLQVGFLPDDPLFLRVCQAYDALQRLFVDLRYLSCVVSEEFTRI